MTATVEKPIAGAFEIELPTELLGRRTPLYPLTGGLVGLLGGAAAAFRLGSGLATTVFCLVFVVFGVGGALYGLHLLRDRRMVLDAVQTLLDTYRVSGLSKSPDEQFTEVLREQLFALRRSGDHRLAEQILETLDPPAADRGTLKVRS